MSVLVNNDTKVVVQGITGKEGSFHARACAEYGTKVVAGGTPGKGGQKMDEVPVFNTVAQAVKDTGANTSLIFVPPGLAARSGTLTYEAVHQLTLLGIGQSPCLVLVPMPIIGTIFIDMLQLF